MKNVIVINNFYMTYFIYTTITVNDEVTSQRTLKKIRNLINLTHEGSLNELISMI